LIGLEGTGLGPCSLWKSCGKAVDVVRSGWVQDVQESAACGIV